MAELVVVQKIGVRHYSMSPSAISARKAGFKCQKKLKARLVAEGICIRCCKTRASVGRLMCSVCAEKCNSLKRKPTYCIRCKQKLEKWPARICSDCASRVCQECGKVFKNKTKTGNPCKFCSRECHRKWRSRNECGEKSPSWKGGLTTEARTFRTRASYKAWRAEVYKRDSFTCQGCGRRGGSLHAHHIKEFSKFPELRLSVENGLTLCLKCHRSIHTRSSQ